MLLDPSSPTIKAVRSSSLTSNSRSRLRSTMFDFASIPPPSDAGDGPPPQPPENPRLVPIDSLIEPGSRTPPELLQRTNVSGTRKPPLHARGGLFQVSIIGSTRP